MANIEALNHVLVDTMTPRHMYENLHWQMSGVGVYQFHLLLDKHDEEQSKLVELIAERVQPLGVVSIAMAADVVETTKLERPPRGREEVPVQLSKPLEARAFILAESHEAAKEAAEIGDDGTNDITFSDIIRTNELEAWFISQHLVGTPLVRAK